MNRKARTVTVGATVEVDGVERDVTLVFICTPAEKSTRDYPGAPAEAEMIDATFDDTMENADEYVDDAEDYADEALSKAEYADTAAQERAEASREDRYAARRERAEAAHADAGEDDGPQY